ncbi:hypothetical protein B484DRAFT_303010, partial [Ochromonadaceae sp. CCMP2298]
YTYGNIQRWSKKFDFFHAEKVVIPINHSNKHWVLVVVFPQRKEVWFYDSMSGVESKRYLGRISQFLEDLWKEKIQAVAMKEQGLVFNLSEWKFEVADTPKQNNGYDCGVFLIRYVEYIIEDLPIVFDR